MRKSILYSCIVAACLFLLGNSGCLPKGVNYVSSKSVDVKVNSNGLTAEQQNIKKRLELSSDGNGLWWIYCLADNGQPVFFGPVKGKVTSSTKKLLTVDKSDGWDGAEGESDAYVYWFDPQGIYYQWSGHYFLTSKEVKIGNAVLNFREVR